MYDQCPRSCRFCTVSRPVPVAPPAPAPVVQPAPTQAPGSAGGILYGPGGVPLAVIPPAPGAITSPTVGVSTGVKVTSRPCIDRGPDCPKSKYLCTNIVSVSISTLFLISDYYSYYFSTTLFLWQTNVVLLVLGQVNKQTFFCN